MTKQIPLRTKDGEPRAFALVSDEDYEYLNQFRWHLGGTGYAARRLRSGEEGKPGGMVYMHREVLGLPRTPGRGTAMQGNHMNFNRIDNRRENLEVVTPGENLAHSLARRISPTCANCGGNEWGLNGTGRRCMPCHRQREENRKRAAGILPRAPIAACRRAGHPYTPENTIVNSRGYRECRACRGARHSARSEGMVSVGA